MGGAAPRAADSKLLGRERAGPEVAGFLRAISDRVDDTADGWRVRRPPHRFDLRIEADLIEEVVRLRGFDSIAETPASAPQIAGVRHRVAGRQRADC